MKNFKTLFFVISLIIVFFIPNITSAMPAPRTAKVFYFSTIEELPNQQNKMTVYLKQSCFEEDKDECEKENDLKEMERLYAGSGYSREKYTSVGSFSAVPILSVVYNKNSWEFYEGEGENQFLKNKKDNKEIFLYGDYYEGQEYAQLNSVVIRDAGDFNGVEVKDYEKYGDFIYVFGSSSVDDYEYYYTIIPFPVVLKAKKITEEDKKEFKEIISSLKMSKQLIGEMAYNTFIYPQGSYPRLFKNLEDIISWGEIAGKTVAQQKEIKQNKSCIFNWPSYLDILEKQECREVGLVGERRITCNRSVILKTENIKFYQTGRSKTPDSYFSAYDCPHRPLFFYSSLFKETKISKDNDVASNILDVLEGYEKESTGNGVSLKEKIKDTVKVYTANTQLNVTKTEDTTTTIYGATIYNISELSGNKIFKYEIERNETITQDNYLYPYFRLYIFELADQNFSLSELLKNKYSEHWVYLGKTHNSLVVAEFIPDSNVELNNKLTTLFYFKIKDLSFLDDNFIPFETCKNRRELICRSENEACEYNKVLTCDDVNINTDFYNHFHKKIINYTDDYIYDDFDKLTENDFLWENEENNTDYVLFPDEIPDDINEIINRQFDTEVNYKNKNLFLVGFNVGCEKNEKICIDKGSGWDYMVDDSRYYKSTLVSHYNFLKTLNTLWYIVILVGVFVVPIIITFYYIIKTLISVIKILKK